MRLINQSAVTDEAIMPLLSFLAAYVPSHRKVVILTENQHKTASITGGWAGLDHDRVIIKLYLRQEKAFTRAYSTRDARVGTKVPLMKVYSWKEEVILVAAHELRHAEQFLANTYALEEEVEAEVDAELFAGMVLEAFRNKGLT